MKFSEKWGDDVESAVELALRDLKCDRSEVEVTVLEEPSKGFLGLGSKLAKVRVEKIGNAAEKEEEAVKEEFKPEPKKAEKPKPERRENKRHEKKAERKPGEDNASQEKRGKRSPFEVKPEGLTPVENHEAVDLLKSITDAMGLELSFKAEASDENLYIEIEGKDAGTIIGKRGQTLDAIQYLTSLAVNKERENYLRVILNAENYRAKREQTLEQLADRLAGKVVRAKRSIRLEPMNPYERMVIHATLQDHPKVVTRSEGDEPYRRVIIELKR